MNSLVKIRIWESGVLHQNIRTLFFLKKENINFQCYINLTLNTLLQELMGRKDLQLLHISQCHGSQDQSAATCTST